MFVVPEAGIEPAQINYVNLHGTSTILNDKIETVAVKIALGEQAYDTPMSATKSQLGHPQGASGAAGIGAALCAMNTGVIPPTINLDQADPDCDLDYVPNVERPAAITTAMTNSFGFGGHNVSLIFGGPPAG